jgi:hypothetical protein
MKKLFVLFLCFIIIFSVNINTFGANNSNSILNTTVKGVNLLSSSSANLDDIKKHGFNTVILNVDNIRNSKKPYNTNYKSLKLLNSWVLKLEKAKLDYIICFNSGPGYSSDGKVISLFKNKFEMNYYSKMIKEIVERYIHNNNFKGASINFLAPELADEKYYEIQDYIINNVRTTYKDLTFVYNLHPLAFEDNLKTLPSLKLTNILLNFTIALKGLTYPGYGVGYKTSCTLNKNSILASLQKLKDFQNTVDSKAIVTIKTPWVKNSEVLLQDFFEISKMVKFDFTLSYGNSSDAYDFFSNSSVLKVLDRHNQ